MKKLMLFGFVLLATVSAHAASEFGLTGRQHESYDDTLNVRSIELTLSGTPGVISTITVPSGAKGFRLYPRSNHIRFMVNAGGSTNQIAAVAASSALIITSTDAARGGIAKNDAWETRLLPAIDNRPRYLYLRSTTASVVVDIEFF